MSLLETKPPPIDPAPPAEMAASPAAEPAHVCASCGLALAADQRCCLECGTVVRERRLHRRLLMASWPLRTGFVLLAALIISGSLGLGASVAFQRGGNLPKPVVVAAAPTPAPPPSTTTAPVAPLAAPAKPPPAVAAPAKPAPVKPTATAHAAPSTPGAGAGRGSTGSSSAPTTATPPTHHPIGGGQSGPSPPFADGTSPFGATLFDPNGNGTADHPDAVPQAIDGDPSTAWTTTNYPHGLTKPGVGITLDAGANIAYSHLGILTRTPGIDVEIYGSTDSSPPQTLPARGWTLLARQVNLPSKQRVKLDVRQIQPRYYLVWITRLPADTGHAGISEASLIR